MPLADQPQILAVSVTTLAEARAAMAAPRAAGTALLLVTEPGACARLGPAYLLEMVQQAGMAEHGARAIIDCGPDAGYAMLALRVGWKELHLTGTPDTVRRIAEMTCQAGGVFHESLPRTSPAETTVAVDQSALHSPCEAASD